MKKLFKVSLGLNLLFVLALLYVFINGRQHVQSYFLEKVIDVRHERKLSMFEACPESNGAIIFLGNSITEGGQWGELFENKKVLNRGIGGDITSGVLARINEVIRHQPSRLFICIGTNDLARGVKIPAIMKDYRLIVKAVNEGSPETKIYINAVLPVGEKVLFGHNNKGIVQLNSEIKKMCAELNIPYIDFYSDLVDENGILRGKYTNDNLHLMGNAYLLWKEKLAPYMMD